MPMPIPMPIPFPQSYWVIPRLFCVGHYPGALDSHEHETKLAGLLNSGIHRVISLIPEGETGYGGNPFRPYAADLNRLASDQGVQIECLCLGFPDGTAPTSATMRRILDIIDASVAAAEPVYVHCWGGHGRTSTTVACHLIRRGMSAQAAIDRILAWRAGLPRNHFPFEGKQEAFVRAWPDSA